MPEKSLKQDSEQVNKLEEKVSYPSKISLLMLKVLIRAEILYLLGINEFNWQELNEEQRRSSTTQKLLKIRNSSLPSRNSECNNSKISTKSICSRMTTLSFTLRNLNVSSKKHSYSTFILAQFSVRENLLVVIGTPETKELKDMMPDILKQVGPQQYQFLKSQLDMGGKTAAVEDDDEDVPQLVGNFEDATKKWTWSPHA